MLDYMKIYAFHLRLRYHTLNLSCTTPNNSVSYKFANKAKLLSNSASIALYDGNNILPYVISRGSIGRGFCNPSANTITRALLYGALLTIVGSQVRYILPFISINYYSSFSHSARNLFTYSTGVIVKKDLPDAFSFTASTNLSY